MVRSSSRICVQPQVLIVAAICLLTIPLPWVVAWFAAAAVHEIGHILAVYLCRGKIDSVSIGLRGAQLHAQPLSSVQAFVCSLAGPLCGGLLLLFSRTFPRLALCALIQNGYNLIPLRPLDGGQACASFCEILFSPPVAKRVMTVLESTALILICCSCLHAVIVLRLGWMPVIFAFTLLAKNKKIKIPCKPSRHRVQ